MVHSLPRASDITICLLGFERHKAHLDLSDDSGYWLLVGAEDSGPFVSAFKSASGALQDFIIEERMNKRTQLLRFRAQIVKIEEGPTQTRVLIRPTGMFDPGGTTRGD